jgi:hypothetical protein
LERLREPNRMSAVKSYSKLVSLVFNFFRVGMMSRRRSGRLTGQAVRSTLRVGGNNLSQLAHLVYHCDCDVASNPVAEKEKVVKE